MSANPRANGGALLRDLLLPDFRDYAVTCPSPAPATRRPAVLAPDPRRDHGNPDRFRLFGPGRGRLEPAQRRVRGHRTGSSLGDLVPIDEHLAPVGRVMEVLSEHLCQGWLEGYLLTGRHGLFTCYEAFIHIVDSMFNQHAKWLSSPATFRGGGRSRR